MKRVLIADDDNASVELFKTTIERLGHNVVAVAYSSEEAITKACEHRPEVALLDIKMDYKTAGIHASNRIKDKFPETKVFFLSGFSKDVFFADLIHADYDGYINKSDFLTEVERLFHDIERVCSA